MKQYDYREYHLPGIVFEVDFKTKIVRRRIAVDSPMWADPSLGKEIPLYMISDEQLHELLQSLDNQCEILEVKLEHKYREYDNMSGEDDVSLWEDNVIRLQDALCIKHMWMDAISDEIGARKVAHEIAY